MSRLITIHTDGGARGNPGPAASGVMIEGLAGNQRLICGKYLGVATNNVAEYTAVVVAFETLLSQKQIDPNQTELKFFTDSLLVAKQLAGEYRIKNPRLAEIAKAIKVFELRFAEVSYQHIPREQNTAADAEVNRILDEN